MEVPTHKNFVARARFLLPIIILAAGFFAASHASAAAVSVTREFGNHGSGTDDFDFRSFGNVRITKIHVEAVSEWEDHGHSGAVSAGISQDEAVAKMPYYPSGWEDMGIITAAWREGPCPNGTCAMAINPGMTGFLFWGSLHERGDPPIECRGQGPPSQAYCFGINSYSFSDNVVSLNWFGVSYRNIYTLTRIRVEAEQLAPVIHSFTKDGDVQYGGATTLRWDSSNADFCDTSWAGRRGADDAIATPALFADQDFAITCAGPGGSVSAGLRVAVGPPPLPTADIKANGSDGPIDIPYNGSATISWSSSGATTCLVSPTGWQGTGNPGISTGSLTQTTTYQIDCDGPGGRTAPADMVTVRVPPPPIGAFDGAGCSSINGWAFDPKQSSASIDVHLYKDGPAGQGGTIIDARTANESRADVDAAYGITGNHGFSWNPIPSSLLDGIPHDLYIHAINTDPTGPNPVINGSPKRISCVPPSISGRVFNPINGAGFAGITVTTCRSEVPTVITDSLGNFSFSVPNYKEGFCVRISPELQPGLDGPFLNNNPGIDPSFKTYEWQVAGWHCAAQGGCSSDQTKWDRGSDSGFDFKYFNPMTGLSASCPSPGTRAALSWNGVGGATKYLLRVNGEPYDNFAGCGAAEKGAEDLCVEPTATSFSFDSSPRGYQWWMHACSGAECDPAATGGATFVCGVVNLSVEESTLIYTPSNPKVGKAMTFSGTVKNTGSAATDRNVTTNLFIKDKTTGIETKVGADMTTNPLAPGGVETEQWTSVWTPTANRIYEFKICTDTGGVIVESLETDNCASKTFTVSTQPDLTVDSPVLIPDPTLEQDMMTFQAAVRNQGGSRAAISIARLRIDQDSDTTWDVQATVTVPGLDPAQSAPIVFRNVWQAVKGTHRYELCADYLGTVTEFDETNNCKVGTFSVLAQTVGVNLTVSSRSGIEPVDVILTAGEITGTARGTVSYSFWWDCANPTVRVADVNKRVSEGGCGLLDDDRTLDDGACTENESGAKCSGESRMSISVPSAGPHRYMRGTHRPKVIVERGIASNQDQETVTVDPPFTFTLTKERDISVVQGATTGNVSIIIVTKTGGIVSSPVAFSSNDVSGLPTGASATFSPASCTPDTGSPPTCAVNPTIAITTTKGIGATPAGSYSLTVTGKSSGSSASVPVTLTVSSAINIDSFTATPSSGSATLTARLDVITSGYTGDPSDSGLYSFWKDCNQTTDIVSDATRLCGAPIQVLITTTGANQTAFLPNVIYATQGTFYPKVIVERGVARRTSVGRVDVSPAFNYDLSSPGTLTVARGFSDTKNIIVTTKSDGVTPQPVSFVASGVTGLPIGATASFNPTFCTPPATVDSSCTAQPVLTINVSTLVTVGTYPITVTDNAPLHKSTTFNLIVTSFDFTVAKDADITAVQGGSGSAIITVNKQAGTPADVTLSVPNLPAGVTAAFTKSGQSNFICTAAELATPCSRTLTLTVARGGTPAAGPYVVTVTGTTAGGGVNGVQLMLTVSSDIQIDSFAPSPTSGSAPLTTVFDVASSGYTGNPNDSSRYSFWKHCIPAHTPTSVADAETMCGSRDDTVLVASGRAAETARSNPLIYASTGTFRPMAIVERSAAFKVSFSSVTVVEPFDYSLSSAAAFSVAQGDFVNVPIKVKYVAGTAATVTFSLGRVVQQGQAGLPDRITSSFVGDAFCTPPVTGDKTCVVTVRLAASPTAPKTVTPYIIEVTDNSPNNQKTTFTLSVSSFSFSLIPGLPSYSREQQQSLPSYVRVTNTGGSPQEVSFVTPAVAFVGTQPGDLTSPVVSTPVRCTPPGGDGTFCDAPFTLTATRDTSPGDYTITFNGTAPGGGVASSAAIPLTITSNMTVTLDAVSDGPLAAKLTAAVSDYTGKPSDSMNFKFWKDCQTDTSSVTTLSGMITVCGSYDTFTDNTTDETPPAVRVTYTASGFKIPKVFVERRVVSKQAQDSVIVVEPFDYSLSNSGGVSINQEQSATVSMIVTHIPASGPPSDVAFDSALVTLTGQSGLPAGVVASFDRASCRPPIGGICSPAPVLTLKTNQAGQFTPVGTHHITVSDNTLHKTTTFDLTVRSYIAISLSAVPSAAGPAPHVLQLHALSSGYTGDPQDLITYTFWKNCDKDGTDATVLSTVGQCGTPDYQLPNTQLLQVDTTDLIYSNPGNYRAKVVITRGAAVNEARIDIAVGNPFTFSIGADRSVVAMVQGQTISRANTARVSYVSGEAQPVQLTSSVSGLAPSAPVPVITFSPDACNPQGTFCTSDISIATARELAAGSYTVTVTGKSGSVTNPATFTLNITSSVNVSLSADPGASGPVPWSLKLRATTSGYTGSASDSINYSFWWDCDNPTDATSEATAGCGNPSDSAVGYKINGVFEGAFTTPTPHIYEQERVFYAKVIVEQGGAKKEARIPIIVGSPKVAVSCSVTPIKAAVNQSVTWNAVATQGQAPYKYAWSRDVSCALAPESCVAAGASYTTTGDKFGTVSVTDGKGDTATSLCANSVKVVQPTLVIDPGAVQIRADGDTVPLKALYDPDGPSGSDAETTVTSAVNWSIPLSQQGSAIVNNDTQKGLVTSKSTLATVVVSGSYRDSYGNTLIATAQVQVIARDALICDPASQNARVGIATFPMRAGGGTGAYDWQADEIDATPRSGSTIGSGAFTTTFSANGEKHVRVRSGSQTGVCNVTVIDQTLSAVLSAFPRSVVVPDSTRLTAVVSGTAIGAVNYSFWWDCGSDKDTGSTARVETAEGLCGILPASVPAGACQVNQFGAKCSGILSESQGVDHAYTAVGASTPKVIVERGQASPAQAKVSVSVDATNSPPVAVAGVSTNPDATRAYASSIVAVAGVPTQVYFAAFIGTESTPDQTSSDPNGWTNRLNGVYHPDDPNALGQCAWNADLDQQALVTFEDVSGINRNPGSPSQCLTSRPHTFTDVGRHTYAVLRITDNRGGVSSAGIVTIEVVPSGSPIALAGVSANSSADRIYRDTVQVKQGEPVQLWVSAKQKVGDQNRVSSDPDGWVNPNGGVAQGGSCRWNRDLDRGLFPTGVPSYEWVINNPSDPAEDCDTQLTNESGTAFSRVFTDGPGTYAYEALRIYDNTGRVSNKGLINVEILPSAAPIAVAEWTTSVGGTFSDTIRVVRGVQAAVQFSAAKSSDPDGWTNPINGVSVSGACDWNSDLNQGAVIFDRTINSPLSPSSCNLAGQNYTFDDRPGIVEYQVLRVTDNKGIPSTVATLKAVVTAPDLVVSSGPLPAGPGGLEEHGATTFLGTIKNQGDASASGPFNVRFTIDLNNDGTIDVTLVPHPTVATLAPGATKDVASASWADMPAGTHKVTLCADQPSPAVGNEYFTDNNCGSQVITVLPEDRSPVAEAGISLDGTQFGSSITVVRDTPVQIWLSADQDINGDGPASFDPDGWSNPAKGVAQGGKCEWNIDLVRPDFAVQNAVNNPASPTICNRARLSKTFGDPPGTYTYKVLRITDVKGARSNVATVQVVVAATESAATHRICSQSICTTASGSGTSVCASEGTRCGPPEPTLPDLVVSQAPLLRSGSPVAATSVTFFGKVKNQSDVSVTIPFKNSFLIDLNDDGRVDVTLQAFPLAGQKAARVGAQSLLASVVLPPHEVTLPLPPQLAELQASQEQEVISGEWRDIPQGTHRVILCVDSDDQVAESDDTNNCSAASQGLITVSPSAPVGGPLRVESCSVSPQSVRAGDAVSWSAVVSGGQGPASWRYSWSGDTPLEGQTANPIVLSYATAGTKSGSVLVTSGIETANRSCGSVNVAAGILSFTATPVSITPGQSSLLAWRSTGFTSCTIDQGIGVVPTNGSRSVTPSLPVTTYNLTCQADGVVPQTRSVSVGIIGTPGFHEVRP